MNIYLLRVVRPKSGNPRFRELSKIANAGSSRTRRAANPCPAASLSPEHLVAVRVVRSAQREAIFYEECNVGGERREVEFGIMGAVEGINEKGPRSRVESRDPHSSGFLALDGALSFKAREAKSRLRPLLARDLLCALQTLSRQKPASSSRSRGRIRELSRSRPWADSLTLRHDLQKVHVPARC